MTDEVYDQAKQVFKSDMETAELMSELVEENDLKEVSEASFEVVENLHGKIDDPTREKCLYATCYQIASAIGNQQLAEFAGEQLERWEQKNG